MLIANTGNLNIIPSTYANGNNNSRTSTKNLSSNSNTGTTERNVAKIDQLIRSKSGSTATDEKNTERSTSSSQTDNSSAVKINDQGLTTKYSGSGELNLYTSMAKFAGSNNSHSKNFAEATNKSGKSNQSNNESGKNSTNFSPVSLSKQAEEAITTLNKTREDLNNQISANSGRIDNSRQAVLAYEDNLKADETKVRDIDIARETTIFTRNQALTSPAVAMMSQSVQSNGNILNLIG